ncbi:MAG: hypothetical protein WDM77_08595 [Steroidobacteraceae bacterium]
MTLRASVLEARAQRSALGLLGVSALLALGCLSIVLITQRSVLAGFAALMLAMLSVAAATPAVLFGTRPAPWVAAASAPRRRCVWP